MRATSVHICIFTNKPPNAGGAYAPETLGQPEARMYAAASSAAVELSNEGQEGTTISMCNANAQEFQAFLQQAGVSAPFIAIAGSFGNQQKFYIVTPAQVENYLRAMWLGDFSGTGTPGTLGDGGGDGFGGGDALICKILPPLCALGFLPWLALAAVTTYKAAESRSTLGKTMWGVPAGLLWLGFFQRGGVKQIQWWAKKARIGNVLSNKAVLHILRNKYGNTREWFMPRNDTVEGYFSLAAQLWQDGLMERRDEKISHGNTKIYFRETPKGRK